MQDQKIEIKTQLSANSLAVLKRRYLKRNLTGEVIETPEELFMRVASYIAQGDANFDTAEEEIGKTTQDFYRMMAKLEFIPNSPTLMNAGRKLGQLSACFVLPIDDNMESIFETVKNTALIH